MGRHPAVLNLGRERTRAGVAARLRGTSAPVVLHSG